MYSKGADMLAIRLPNEINERLNDLAEKTGRTKSFYAREAILKHLEDLEDIYLAEKELEDVRAGKSKVYTAEEIGKKLGL
jgi:RHH-type rel operon transcriptional repressor/antitoxin RelB